MQISVLFPLSSLNSKLLISILGTLLSGKKVFKWKCIYQPHHSVLPTITLDLIIILDSHRFISTFNIRFTILQVIGNQ